MLKQLRGLEGSILAPIRATDLFILPDILTYSNLKASLGAFDWTYLALITDNETEVIRVNFLAGANTLAVTRAMYGTVAINAVDARLKYVETLESIGNNYSVSPLVVSPTNGLGYEEGIVFYPDITIEHLGNSESVGTQNIHIGIKSIAICCVPVSPSSIPVKYYPYRVTDDDTLRVTDDEEIRTTE